MAKIDVLIEELKANKYQDRFLDIYVDEGVLEYQKERYIKALEGFKAVYGDRDVCVFSAPGRSEVGGNHTDHQLGKVLATSLNLDVIAVASKTDDQVIDVKSEGYDAVKLTTDQLEIDPAEEGTSLALIRGVAAGMKMHGYEIGGFVAYMTSDVLGGSGMSSSAAYEVCVTAILSGLYNDGKLDAITAAIISQMAENKYFGKPCGLLDQMACSVGGLVNIDFEDPADPKVKKVNVDFGAYDHSLCIVDTKGSHANLTDEYAAVPAEMKAVAACLGKEVLRQVDEKEFFDRLPQIRETAGDRGVLRAIHFFEEERRVDGQVAALESGDFEGFKKLIKASGDSSYKFLQNVFSVKDLQKQGVSMGLAVSEMVLGDRGVCRVHGGGFAGTIQAFVPVDLVASYREAMDHVFGEGACHVLKVRKYGGICVLD